MSYIKQKHTATGQVFHSFDQERLWLAKSYNAACIEGTEYHLAARAMAGIVEYVEPVPAPKPLAEVKTQAIATVKETRKTTLDRYQKYSTGIARIYLDNLFAAQKFLADDISLMATGQTPEQYLTLLGAELGMTAAQFANYIIGENIRLGAPAQAIPSAYDVEQRYLRASVAIQYAATVEAVQVIADDYTAFCQPVTGQ